MNIIEAITYSGIDITNKIIECLIPAMAFPSEILPMIGPAKLACMIRRYKKYALKFILSIDTPEVLISLDFNIGKNTI